MFSGTPTAFTLPREEPDLTQVKSMQGMFYCAPTTNIDCLFNDPNIAYWDTSNVEDMSYMFYSVFQHNWDRGNRFNQNIGNWNTANVTKMNDMFSGAKDFNQDISRWNTSQVTDMSRMFY